MILGLNPEHFSVLVSVFEPLFFFSGAVFFLASATAIVTVQRFKTCRTGLGAQSNSTDRDSVDHDLVLEQARNKHGSLEPTPQTCQSERLDAGDADPATRSAAQRTNIDLRAYHSRLQLLANISHYVPQLGLIGAAICLTVGFGQLYLSGSPLGISTVAGGIWLVLLAISLAVLVAIPTFVAHAWIENRIEPRRGVKTDTKTAPSGNRVSAQSACGN